MEDLTKEIEAKRQKITYDKIIESAQAMGVGKNVRWVVMDPWYYALPWDTWVKIMDNLQVYKEKYKDVLFDCDDFAKDFFYNAGNLATQSAVGWVADTGGHHSYNLVWLINDDGSFGCHVVEPQQSPDVKHAIPWALKHWNYLCQSATIILG